MITFASRTPVSSIIPNPIRRAPIRSTNFGQGHDSDAPQVSRRKLIGGAFATFVGAFLLKTPAAGATGTGDDAFASFIDSLRNTANIGNGYYLPIPGQGMFVGPLGYFGMDRDGWPHLGIDLYGPARPPHADTTEHGSLPAYPIPVFAPINGTVVDVVRTEMGNNYIKFQGDDGFYYNLIHLAGPDSAIAGEIPGGFHGYLYFDRIHGLQIGQRLPAGALIGFVGNSGTPWYHLHFEVKTALVDGQINPLDPAVAPPGLLAGIHAKIPGR